MPTADALSWSVFATGFGVSISLILAIGAQNAFILRQGLRGRHVLAVVLTCAISDAILICTGVFGGATITRILPGFAPAMTWLGAAFLIVYGALSLRSAWRGGHSLEAAEGPDQTLVKAVAVCMALTWLNPHVYLDTVLLVGAVAQTYPDHTVSFAGGATTASFVFFTALGFGARLLRPVFARPAAWRVLDAGTGVLMWAIAYGLLMHS